MEKLRRRVNQIAYTQPSQWLSTLSPLQLSLIPLLSFASTVYGLALSLRHHLYRVALFRQHRLPVPVISVGNLTWGGNGKTPTVEYIARCLANSGISPLILTRGYGSADEAKMLQRHLHGTSAKIGVGANRAVTAATYIERYGYMNRHGSTCSENLFYNEKSGSHFHSNRIGAAILDDGMQHLGLSRDLEIVMVNGLMPWGNRRLLPLGPLREPLTGLVRADIVVIHHADLVPEQSIEAIKLTIREVKDSLPIFCSKMAPSYFLKSDNLSCKVCLSTVYNVAVLCVSAIGSADSFVKTIEKMGPMYVDRLDFSDHHSFQIEDIDVMRMRLQRLEVKFASKPVVVVTEKTFGALSSIAALFSLPNSTLQKKHEGRLYEVPHAAFQIRLSRASMKEEFSAPAEVPRIKDLYSWPGKSVSILIHHKHCPE